MLMFDFSHSSYKWKGRVFFDTNLRSETFSDISKGKFSDVSVIIREQVSNLKLVSENILITLHSFMLLHKWSH